MKNIGGIKKRFFIISAWDNETDGKWRFYTKLKKGKYHFSPDVNDAEKYVKKAWAEKCRKKMLLNYNENSLFNTLNAEVLEIHR